MKLLIRILKKQAGQALPMALVLLALGAMIIVPTLVFTTTNLKATRVVDQKTREVYAADAGIEHALWHLQSEDRLTRINPTNSWPMLPYELDDPINHKDVTVTIDKAWILSGLLNLPVSEPDEYSPYYANDHWTVIGAINIDIQPRKNYVVDITTNEAAGTAYVDHIAVWLPQGYSYVSNSVKINGVAIDGNALVKNPDNQLSYRGGTALIWYYSGTAFKSLSDIAPGGAPPTAKFPPSVRLSFDYNVTPFIEAKGFFPWINLSTGNRIAWDADAGFYHVESTGTTPETGTSTTVEAYVPKGVMRYVSGSSGATSAIQGDYIAIGNSLMTCCWKTTTTPCDSSSGGACSCCKVNNPYRNYAPAPVIFTGAGYPLTDVERESSATVDTSGTDIVPDDAKIERVYLYWTAWLRGKTVWEEQGQTPAWTWSPESTAPQYVKDWLKEHAYDGKAYLAVDGVKVAPVNTGDPAGTVLANTWYISEGSSDVQPSYQYACFADVTAQVKEITPNLSGTTFTVAGVHAHPADACALIGGNWNYSPNAGWSMVIIYSSAQKKTHQIYLYAGCDHLYIETAYFPITGFAAPLASDLLPGETNEAKMTVFASEGDSGNTAEYLGFKGQTTSYYQLYDVSGTQYVFNSISSATGFTASQIYTCPPTGEISGIDIDTYTATKPDGTMPLSTIVQPGDISATIKAQSTGDGFEIIYVVFSVRSTAVPAGQEFDVGTMMYRIQ
ncbi:MAG: hypothetical protein MUO89_07225 [Dehalococcoidia bacterium]|nr:hypothetical protein [Dehalococcoidia bacterium]